MPEIPLRLMLRGNASSRDDDRLAIKKLICLWCGEQFETFIKSQLYCSDNCQRTRCRRIAAMRLGIPPRKNYLDPLENPWLE